MSCVSPACRTLRRSCPQAPAISSPISRRRVAEICSFSSTSRKVRTCCSVTPFSGFPGTVLSGMRFDPLLKIGEDTVFFMQYLTRCSSLVAIPNGLYAYCYRDVSAMGSARAEKLVQNDLLMLELMGSEVWKRPILAAIIYRMIIPKLQERKMRLCDIARYRLYLDKICMKSLLQSSLPIKTKVVAASMKIIVRIL